MMNTWESQRITSSAVVKLTLTFSAPIRQWRFSSFNEKVHLHYPVLNQPDKRETRVGLPLVATLGFEMGRPTVRNCACHEEFRENGVYGLHKIDLQQIEDFWKTSTTDQLFGHKQQTLIVWLSRRTLTILFIGYLHVDHRLSNFMNNNEKVKTMITKDRKTLERMGTANPQRR
jgi:hypothetical protein